MDTDRSRKNKRIKERGAASIEAVILLPFFLLILMAIIYVENLYEMKQKSYLQARRCAWQYANSGCDKERVSKDCWKHLQNAKGIPGRNELEEQMHGGILDGLSALPFIGAAVRGLLGHALIAEVKEEMPKQAANYFGRIAVSGNFYLICNEKPQDMHDLIQQVFCKRVGSDYGCP